MGGFSGGHMGGFSGGHVGGMGGMHMGGFSSPAIRSFSGPSMGGMRAPSSLGGMRAGPSVGGLGGANLGGMRVSPGVSGMRSPNLNLGSTMARPGGGSLSRATVGSVRPNIGSVGTHPGTVFNPHATLGNRTALGGAGQTGLRLNQGGVNTSLRPSTGINGLTSRTGATAGSLHMPGVGRVTPQHVSNFLSMPNHNVGGLGGNHVGNLGNRTNVSNLGGRTTNINNINSFNRINNTQFTRINNNLNNGFRNNFNRSGFRSGFGYYGYPYFGFGFGSPFFNNWAYGVRGFWNPYGYYGLFGSRFWATNYLNYPWYSSSYYGAGYPYSYWWGTPTWGGLNNWFSGYGWNSPYYYGYGPGGNIVYNNGNVYVDDVPIATAADYAASAATLAEVPTPANPDQPAQWLALGTFALSESETDKDPARVVQLAVDKDGIISGSMYNKNTKQLYAVQGRVDKDTQRVAFTIGDAKDVVFETGIYNLTQQQTPILAHGDGREEVYLLLRLEQPSADGSAAIAPAPAAIAPAPPSRMSLRDISGDGCSNVSDTF